MLDGGGSRWEMGMGRRPLSCSGYLWGPFCAQELSPFAFTSPRIMRNWLLVCSEWATYLWFFQLLSLYHKITSLENSARGRETAQNWLHCVEKTYFKSRNKIFRSWNIQVHGNSHTKRNRKQTGFFFPRRRLRKPKGMFQLGKSGFCRKNVVVKAWGSWWGRRRKQSGFVGSWSRLLMREAQDCMQMGSRAGTWVSFHWVGRSLDHPTNYLWHGEIIFYLCSHWTHAIWYFQIFSIKCGVCATVGFEGGTQLPELSWMSLSM